jgi:hypothetical protein
MNRDAYKVLVGKPGGLRAPEMPRHNQEDNIGMDLKVIKRKVGDWMYVAQDRDHWLSLVNTVM